LKAEISIEEQQRMLLGQVRDSVLGVQDGQRRGVMIHSVLEVAAGIHSPELACLLLVYAERFTKRWGWCLTVFIALLFHQVLVICYLGMAMGASVAKNLSATKRRFLRSRFAVVCRRCCCPAEPTVELAEVSISIPDGSPDIEEKRSEFLREKVRLSDLLRATKGELDGLPERYAEEVGRAWLGAEGHVTAPAAPEAAVDGNANSTPSLFQFMLNPIEAWFGPA
jgi:hypothetical protein